LKSNPKFSTTAWLTLTLLQLLPVLLLDLDIALHPELLRVGTMSIAAFRSTWRSAIAGQTALAFARAAFLPPIGAHSVYDANRMAHQRARFRSPAPSTVRDGLPASPLRRKTFDSMAKERRAQPLRQLRHARDKMRRIKLAVGSGNRTSDRLLGRSPRNPRRSSSSTWLRR
jgi:hypothetical protein